MSAGPNRKSTEAERRRGPTGPIATLEFGAIRLAGSGNAGPPCRACVTHACAVV